jgi:hypothetical protein
MSLPSLQWRKLPVRTFPYTTNLFTASLVLNTLYDMLTGSAYYDNSTRIPGSGSAWSASIKFTTGSNTEAVVCRPPLYTVMSQSIIFGAINHFGASSSATPVMCANETYSASYIYMACVKDASGSFTEWTSRHPFGSGSYSTGYGKIAGTAHMSGGERITVYESKEAIAVLFANPATNFIVHCGIGGAIIDPEQNADSIDAENDDRIYAIATSGVGVTSGYGLAPLFVIEGGSASGSLFTHRTEVSATTFGYSRFVGFYPQQKATMNIMSQKTNWTNIAGYNPYYVYYTTLSGKLIQNSILCGVSGSANTNYYLGRLRDINITQAIPSNQIIRDSENNIAGFTLAYSETTVLNGNTVLFPYN